MIINIVPEVIFPQKNIKLDIKKVVSVDYCDRIMKSDFNLINLECVLTNGNNPREKWGSLLKSDLENAAFLKQIPNAVINLSNNHVLDYGISGLEDTINELENREIKYVGASISDKYDKKIFTKDDVAIYACCESDSYAESDGEVVSIYDSQRNILDIINLKKTYDHVICLYHGGTEFYPYPSPMQRKRLRAMVDAGADLVICQHNHCVSCEERYNDGVIIYGQGTLFWGDRDEIKDNIIDIDMMNSGMIVNYDSDTKKVECNFFKTDGNRIVSYDDEIKKEYYLRSDRITEEGFVEKEWKKFCLGNSFYMDIFGETYNKKSFKRRIKELIGVVRKRNHNNRDKLRVNNYITCESNFEIIKTLSELKKGDL